MSDDTHEQWQLFNQPDASIIEELEQLVADDPYMTARRLYCIAVARSWIGRPEYAEFVYEFLQQRIKRTAP